MKNKETNQILSEFNTKKLIAESAYKIDKHKNSGSIEEMCREIRRLVELIINPLLIDYEKKNNKSVTRGRAVDYINILKRAGYLTDSEAKILHSGRNVSNTGSHLDKDESPDERKAKMSSAPSIYNEISILLPFDLTAIFEETRVAEEVKKAHRQASKAKREAEKRIQDAEAKVSGLEKEKEELRLSSEQAMKNANVAKENARKAQSKADRMANENINLKKKIEELKSTSQNSKLLSQKERELAMKEKEARDAHKLAENLNKKSIEALNIALQSQQRVSELEAKLKEQQAQSLRINLGQIPKLSLNLPALRNAALAIRNKGKNNKNQKHFLAGAFITSAVAVVMVISAISGFSSSNGHRNAAPDNDSSSESKMTSGNDLAKSETETTEDHAGGIEPTNYNQDEALESEDVNNTSSDPSEVKGRTSKNTESENPAPLTQYTVSDLTWDCDVQELHSAGVSRQRFARINFLLTNNTEEALALSPQFEISHYEENNYGESILETDIERFYEYSTNSLYIDFGRDGGEMILFPLETRDVTVYLKIDDDLTIESIKWVNEIDVKKIEDKSGYGTEYEFFDPDTAPCSASLELIEQTSNGYKYRVNTTITNPTEKSAKSIDAIPYFDTGDYFWFPGTTSAQYVRPGKTVQSDSYYLDTEIESPVPLNPEFHFRLFKVEYDEEE